MASIDSSSDQLASRRRCVASFRRRRSQWGQRDALWTYGAYDSTAAVLQLVIDAGGDVNQSRDGAMQLFAAVRCHIEGNARVPAQPCLDLTIALEGDTPEQYVTPEFDPALVDVIAQEMRGEEGCPFCTGAFHGVGVASGGLCGVWYCTVTNIRDPLILFPGASLSRLASLSSRPRPHVVV